MLAHNLIHKTCAEKNAALWKTVPSDGDAVLPSNYARELFPYESRAWTPVTVLAHNLIHIKCAEAAVGRKLNKIGIRNG